MEKRAFYFANLTNIVYICLRNTRKDLSNNKKNEHNNSLNKLIMNKTELINAIAEGAALSKVDAKKALDATLGAVENALKAGDKVALIGFGTFEVATRAAREGFNPATKEKVQIPAKNVVKFKAGAALNDAVK